MRRLGALLLCAALLTAGCIGTVEAGTAKEHRSTADERADRFAGPDAELISVTGFETNVTDEGWYADERDDPEDAAKGPADDTIGDGEAPAWVYTYQTSNLTYQVTVAQNGTVIANETEDDVDEDAVPIGEWEVTSDEAADIVADNNDGWTTSEDGFGVYALARENETTDPIWNLGQFIPEEGAVFARVNATTGEYLGTYELDFDFDFDFDYNYSGDYGYGGGYGGDYDYGSGADGEEPPEEGGSFSGTLTATDSSNEESLELDASGHDELVALVELDGQSAGSSVDVTISSPSGDQRRVTVSGMDGSRRVEIGEPAKGVYDVTLELTQGVTQNYTFTWCAEGHPTGDDAADDACERIEDADDDRTGVRMAPR